MTAHLSVFINGCLDDYSGWHETHDHAFADLVQTYDCMADEYEVATLSDGATVRKYMLWVIDDETETLLDHMAEIVEYPSLLFCDCSDTRMLVDNETGMYDPELSVCCMACENEQYDAYEQQMATRERREHDALGFVQFG